MMPIMGVMEDKALELDLLEVNLQSIVSAFFTDLFGRSAAPLFWNEVAKTLDPRQPPTYVIGLILSLTVLWTACAVIARLLFFDDLLRIFNVKKKDFSLFRSYCISILYSIFTVIWGLTVVYQRYSTDVPLLVFDHFETPMSRLYVCNGVAYFAMDLLRGILYGDLTAEYLLHHVTSVLVFGYPAVSNTIGDISFFSLLIVECPGACLSLRMMFRFVGKKGCFYYWVASYSFSFLFLCFRWPLEMYMIYTALHSNTMPVYYIIALASVHTLTWYWAIKIMQLFKKSFTKTSSIKCDYVDPSGLKEE